VPRDDPPSRFCSYRNGFRQHPIAEFCREVARCENVDRDAEKLLKVDLQSAEVEQCGSGQNIDQQVEIAALNILAADHGAENPAMARAVGFHGAANLVAIDAEGLGWLHSVASWCSEMRWRRNLYSKPIIGVKVD
jgi:hypothetical protein